MRIIQKEPLSVEDKKATIKEFKAYMESEFDRLTSLIEYVSKRLNDHEGQNKALELMLDMYLNERSKTGQFLLDLQDYLRQ
jgi:hypothetical protein